MIYRYNLLFIYIPYLPYMGWRNNLNFLTTLTLKWIVYAPWLITSKVKLIKYKLVSVNGLKLQTITTQVQLGSNLKTILRLTKLHSYTVLYRNDLKPVTSGKRQGFINLDYIYLSDCFVMGFFISKTKQNKILIRNNYGTRK